MKMYPPGRIHFFPTGGMNSYTIKSMTKINDWKNYFRTNALREGYNLFLNRKVTNFRETDESRFVANVDDKGLRRRVVMRKVGDRLLGECNCYEGGRGYFCRHMAAALYYNDANGTSEAVLFKEEDFADCYFNLAQMTKDMRYSARTIREAKLMIQAENIHLGKVNIGYRTSYNGSSLYGIAQGVVYDGTFAKSVELQFTKNKIESADCHVCFNYYYASPYSSRGLCAHETALLILLGDYIRKFNPGDETSLSGAVLLNSFAGMQAIRKIDESTTRDKVISLEPRLALTYEGLELSFRIGASKMYVLKNMQELEDTKENFGVMTLGKGNELHFARETFTEEGEKYYNFIQEQLREEKLFRQRVMRQYGDLSGSDSRSSFDLRGQVLDDFFDLAYGRSIPFNDKTDRISAGTLLVKEASYHLDLKVEKMMEGNKFTGVSIRGEMLPQFAGARSVYFIRDNTLARLSPQDSQFIQPFLEAAQDGQITMTVGVSRLSEFYYRVLPALRENPMITIEEDSSVEEYLPPEARFDFFLDTEDSFVTCLGRVTYDEQSVDLKEITADDLPLPRWRDYRQENEAFSAVLELFSFFDKEKGLFWDEMDDDKLYELLDSGVRRLNEIGDVHGSDAFNRLRIRRTPVVNVGVSLSSNLLDLEITTQQLSEEELLEVLESYRRKKKFHRLKSGEFIAFDQNESLDMLAVMMDAMGISLDEFVKGKLHLPAYRALYVNKMLEEHDSIAADRDRNFRNLIRRFNSVKDSEYDVPAAMKQVLRGYQEYGYKWLRTLSDLGFGGILADDMGLGKTIQMIAYLLACKEAGETRPSLIVCPASVVFNWAEEFARFAPSLKVIPLAGTAGARAKLMGEETDVFITSYDLLKRDIGKYKGMEFACEVLDEGQFIKNPKAAVSKAVKIVEAEHRFVLTGTPIENRLSELWSIFDYLMPGFLYTYDRFRTDFETPIAKNKDEVITAQLRRMVSPFILRRLKQDVLKDLPEKMEEVRYARFDEAQQKVYDGQVVRMKQMIASADANTDRIKILAELTRIRQICCDPSLILENYEGESAKKDACLQLIQSAIDGGHKMLVFSQFTSMLEILRKELDENKIGYYVITGATPKEERLKLVHRFNENDVPVFLISLKAGGTGLNLTGADVVIHYDPWWNLAAQNQATDRAHRIGQKSTVTVYRIIAKDTIEERILELQEAKKDLSDAILSGEASSLAALSKEELMELLG